MLFAGMLQGVLLYGPPGTGKTLLARAVAHHTDCTFIRVSGSELVQKYIGEGSRMVRELFVMARYASLLPDVVLLTLHVLLQLSPVHYATHPPSTGRQEPSRVWILPSLCDPGLRGPQWGLSRLLPYSTLRGAGQAACSHMPVRDGLPLGKSTLSSPAKKSPRAGN